jgi:hypothetical protein
MRALGGCAEPFASAALPPNAITGMLRTSRVSVSPLYSGGLQPMTAQRFTPPQAALVGIDIAKNRHEVLIDPGPGMRRRRLTVLNTRAEHDRLVATLVGLGKPVIVGFEPTGNYHRSLVHRLVAAGFEARLISSLALARTREALHNGWDKNDPKDAQVILHMLRIGASTVYSDQGVVG